MVDTVFAVGHVFLHFLPEPSVLLQDGLKVKAFDEIRYLCKVV